MRSYSTDMMERKSIRRNDILLVAALLLAAAVGALCLFLFRGAGDTVRVTVDGELYGVYALSENRTEDIYTGKDTGQHNRLVIRDGKAFIETATCPDGICAAHRPIYRDGESIVCRPHGVVVTVTAAPTDDTPDAVA